MRERGECDVYSYVKGVEGVGLVDGMLVVVMEITLYLYFDKRCENTGRFSPYLARYGIHKVQFRFV